MDNFTIAHRLTQHARELDARGENLFRVRAYRRGAQIVLGLDRPVEEMIATGGSEALAALPGIGTHLAFTIEHLARTGEFLTYDEARAARCSA